MNWLVILSTLGFALLIFYIFILHFFNKTLKQKISMIEENQATLIAVNLDLQTKVNTLTDENVEIKELVNKDVEQLMQENYDLLIQIRNIQGRYDELHNTYKNKTNTYLELLNEAYLTKIPAYNELEIKRKIRQLLKEISPDFTKQHEDIVINWINKVILFRHTTNFELVDTGLREKS